MSRLALTSLACLLAVSPALAQTTTATGVAVSGSRARSESVAISGTGGNGGQGAASSNLTINSNVPAETRSTQTATVRQELTGTSTIKNVPAVFAPGLAAAGLETCLGSVSGGGAAVGFGASFGTTVPDPGCNARLDARTLWSMGLKKAAVARLCLGGDIYRSMPEICAQYLPREGYAVAEVEPAVYTGGPVEVVVRRTGERRLCADYNVARQRCRVWAR